MKWSIYRAILLDDPLYLKYSVFREHRHIEHIVNIPSADPEKISKSLIGQKDNCACIFGNLGM